MRVTRKTALVGISSMVAAGCGGVTVQPLRPSKVPSSGNKNVMTVLLGKSGTPRFPAERKRTTTDPTSTLNGPDGSTVTVGDNYFNGYDELGNFVAQFDTSQSDDAGMPILYVVGADGSDVTVNFPDISNVSAGTPFDFTFQDQHYRLLPSADHPGNVTLTSLADNTTLSITEHNGDRTVTDIRGRSWTLPGDEIDRLASGLMSRRAASGQRTSSNAGGSAPGLCGPVNGQTGVAVTTTVAAGSARHAQELDCNNPPPVCTPEWRDACLALRDAAAALFVLALIAIGVVAAACIAASWFILTAYCTLAAGIAIALAVGMFLHTARVFNAGYCGRVCHVIL